MISTIFKTKRLNVFSVRIQENEELGQSERPVFFATLRLEDRPMIIATAMVFDEADYWLDWIEVSTEYRRQGIATEFLDGIEDWLGVYLMLTGGTDDGEQFVAAYNEATK